MVLLVGNKRNVPAVLPTLPALTAATHFEKSVAAADTCADLIIHSHCNQFYYTLIWRCVKLLPCHPLQPHLASPALQTQLVKLDSSLLAVTHPGYNDNSQLRDVFTGIFEECFTAISQYGRNSGAIFSHAQLLKDAGN